MIIKLNFIWLILVPGLCATFMRRDSLSFNVIYDGEETFVLWLKRSNFHSIETLKNVPCRIWQDLLKTQIN